MIDLSVVIVNYNVKYFLEQCLNSVSKASNNLTTEIIVVDNNSVDGSCAMVRQKFPGVRLIENKQNLGFSKANNQAIKISAGRYILLLNPDTVVQEDTFSRVVAFMDSHPDAGALGVKMIDGKGNFLPESKRSLPTPLVAFYKIFGLAKLFPKSRIFGKYHVGYLSNEKIHKVDVLSGAFMLVRREAFEKAGLLDEDYFMYGEDIDLSYRILKADFNNYYFSETTIIHYKGESTRKSSINYVVVFYKAMLIFARKHFSRKNAAFFTFLISLAVYFRAALAITRRFITTAFYPLADASIIFYGFYLLSPWWGSYKFGSAEHFPPFYLWYIIPAYILIWLLCLFYTGAYDKPLRITKIFKGIAIGSVIILIVYALLPETMRFSRAMIIIGTCWSMVLLFLYRLLIFWSGNKNIRFGDIKRKRIAIVGEMNEIERVEAILHQTGNPMIIAGYILPAEEGENIRYLGNCSQLREIVKINHIDEIVFCAYNVEAFRIIQYMLNLTDLNIDYKIAQPESMSIVGSNSVHTAGELYVINLNTISTPVNRRLKRLFDVSVAAVFLISFPLFAIYAGKPARLLKNIILVFMGIKSWVGYIPYDRKKEDLPDLKPGVIFPHFSEELYSQEQAHHINIFYAKDYSVLTDLSFVIKNIRYIGA